MKPTILVIKHGALGDIILATAAFAAIRAHHPDQPIVLLTSTPFVDLAKRMPYFDEVWVDDRPKWWRVFAWFRVWRLLQGHGPSGRVTIERVYDLQGSDRTGLYHRLLVRPPEWFGALPSCSHPRPFPAGQLHAFDSLREHLGHYGVSVAATPDVSWLQADAASLSLPTPYALLIPGCSYKHAVKRWSAEGFAEVINRLAVLGVHSVLVGMGKDSEIINAIILHVNHPDKLTNLCDHSSLPLLATLARRASVVLGVDTGPIHCAAATNAPTLVLFSSHSRPAMSAPKGAAVQVVAVDNLCDLGAEQVMTALLRHVPQLQTRLVNV